jgi:hypothetical protein
MEAKNIHINARAKEFLAIDSGYLLSFSAFAEVELTVSAAMSWPPLH